MFDPVGFDVRIGSYFFWGGGGTTGGTGFGFDNEKIPVVVGNDKVPVVGWFLRGFVLKRDGG